MTEQARENDNPYISPPEQTDAADQLCMDENGQIDYDALLAQYKRSRSPILFSILCISLPFGIFLPILSATLLAEYVDQVYLYKMSPLPLILATAAVIFVIFRYCLIPPMGKIIRESRQLCKMIGLPPDQPWTAIEHDVRSILTDAGKLPPRKSLAKIFGLTRKRENDNI